MIVPDDLKNMDDREFQKYLQHKISDWRSKVVQSHNSRFSVNNNNNWYFLLRNIANIYFFSNVPYSSIRLSSKRWFREVIILSLAIAVSISTIPFSSPADEACTRISPFGPAIIESPVKVIWTLFRAHRIKVKFPKKDTV